MSDKIFIEIVTPEKRLIESSCFMATIPGLEGMMGVMVNHVPLIALLKPGIISLYSDDKNIFKEFFVNSGFAEITPTRIEILVDKAFIISEYSKDQIQKIIDNNNDQLSKEENLIENLLFQENTILNEIIKNK